MRACVRACVRVRVFVFLCKRVVHRVRPYLYHVRRAWGFEGWSGVEVKDKDKTRTHATPNTLLASHSYTPYTHACTAGALATHAHHARKHVCDVCYVMHVKLGLHAWRAWYTYVYVWGVSEWPEGARDGHACGFYHIYFKSCFNLQIRIHGSHTRMHACEKLVLETFLYLAKIRWIRVEI